MATCTIQTTLTIATEGALNLTQISGLLDDLLAVGFADAADSAEIDKIAGALKEIGVTAPSSTLDVRLHAGEFCFLSNPIKASYK